MRVLQRETLKEIGLVFTICLISFLFLLLVGRLLQMRNLFVGQGLSLMDLGRLFLYLSPFFLLLLLPVACMTSVFLTFLRMATDQELVALRAAGIGLRGFLPAPVLFCALAALLAYATAFWGISWGIDNFRSTLLDLVRSKAKIVIRPGVFNTDFPGLTIYARQVSPDTEQLENIFVNDSTDQGLSSTLIAPEGRISTDHGQGLIYLSLHNGTMYRQDKNGLSILGFESYNVRLDLEKILGGYTLDSKRPMEMSWAELGRILATIDQGEEDRSVLRNQVVRERQKRLALPLACLILGLFSVPLAFLFQGLRRQFGLVLAMFCFLLYYTLFSAGISLSETGIISPYISFWIPNAVFTVLTAAGFVIVRRERGFRITDWVLHLFRLWARPKTTAGATPHV
ncbi:MAG: LPS export ABC transporter permease LptF [Deltaproteobacteria bacterium]|nr:LPS export ABC transporter permease LptF [Deltaproteobacteria bacterium]